MISLKRIKFLTHFYRLETNLFQNFIWNSKIYSTCGPFTKRREIIQKFRETGNIKHLHRDELDKACFVHDTACSDSKDFTKRIISDKILKDRAYEIAKNRGYDGYQRALVSMAYKIFYEKTRSGVSVTEKQAEELH